MAKRRIIAKKKYNAKSIIREREYGFYWYSGLWRVLRPLFIFMAALVIVMGVVSNGWLYLYNSLLKPMDTENHTTVAVEIPKNTTVTGIAKILKEQNLLRSDGLFRYLVMFQGVTNKMHYGTYQIAPSMSMNEMIGVLTSGSESIERTITIIPGWTIDDIAANLRKAGAIKDINAFIRLCNDTVEFSNYYTVDEIIKSQRLQGRRYVLEGYLAPDTYRVLTDASDADIIRRLLDQTDIVLNSVYDKIAIDTDAGAQQFQSALTRDETIVLASMIEKEAVKKEDFARVSAVFHNRLKAGMRLESDPTVKYTTKSTKLILSPDELNVQTPFNTYVVSGLPIGPICNPSKLAIEAALLPDMEYINGQYLYFCSKDPDSGELQFSRSLEEHNAAVVTYRPIWQAFDERQSMPAATQQPAAGNT